VEEIAEVYARSIFEVAKERAVLDEVKEQLDEFSDALSENHDLAVYFFSPYFSTDEKKDGLSRLLEDAESSFINFLEALIERHRMPAIFRIRARVDDLWEKENRRLPVEVTSAVELDEATIRDIGARIGEQTGHEVDLESRVDPEILGGIVLRVGNSVLDASIKNRLNQLRKEVAQA
jgi:F-type H+-transporting ATPase subunit delta